MTQQAHPWNGKQHKGYPPFIQEQKAEFIYQIVANSSSLSMPLDCAD
jgi:hypothetical protein